MHSSITKAIQSSGHVIPKENIQPGYFSCFRSTTETTYRTTITCTENVSAVDYAAWSLSICWGKTLSFIYLVVYFAELTVCTPIETIEKLYILD